MGPSLIINGTLVSASWSRQKDIAVEGGKITCTGKIDPDDFAGCQVIDATGRYIFPGGFDPHVHLALPTPAGNSCDDFRNGSLAALAGGTTFFMDFVTPHRGQSLAEALRLRREEAAQSLTGCGLHMGISEWNPGIASEILPLMEREGICSFKAYLAYPETIGIGYGDLRELMQIVGPAGGVVMVHCEEGGTIAGMQRQLIAEGKTRPCFHAVSRPAEAEVSAIEKVIGMSALTGCPVYIVHISTGRGADLVAAAKKDGIRVYAETCPHYLLFDDSVYDPGRKDLEALPFILSPPIRTKDDREHLWERVADGTFDTIGTDHCPFNVHGQKDRGLHNFTKIPNGTGGIRHRLGLMYTNGVLPGKITLNRFIDLVSTKPAEIFGYGGRKGKLLPGYDADLVIWDPKISRTVSRDPKIDTCDSDIYEGMALTGGPVVVVTGGRSVR